MTTQIDRMLDKMSEQFMRPDIEDEDEGYQVIVGNIGMVYTGSEEQDALSCFNVYVEQSKSRVGRAGDEAVTMLHGGDIVREYLGAIEDEA